MKKFVLKFLCLFIIVISVAFFSLTSFQKTKMQKEAKIFQQQQFSAIQAQTPGQMHQAAPGQMPPAGDMTPPVPMGAPQSASPMPKDPPASVPMLIIISISSLFILFLLMYLNKNYVAPLEKIQENVSRIKNGNLDLQFETESESTNIQETYKTLNEMVEGLVLRNKLQDEFIRNLVHDLRSPIIAQERAIAILQDEFKDHELLDGMMENSEMYLDMINLIIEAHSTHDVKIDKIKFNLTKLTKSLIHALTPAAVEKQITLINTVEDETYIFADYISSVRIITNLISNAIENIPNGKTISVGAKNCADKTIITVEDNSGTISQKDAEHIFDKFTPKNKTGRKSVSGLGLQIVHQLVLRNGGNIKLDRAENKFTKFIIELPRG